MVPERKHCIVPFSRKTSVICPSNIPKPLFSEWIPSNGFDIYRDEISVLQTFETHKTYFRPIPVRLQAQQKHRGRTADPSTLCIHSPGKASSFVRNLFTQFSSTVGAIQPHLMAQELLKLEVNPRLVLWQLFSNSSLPLYALVFPLWFNRLWAWPCPIDDSLHALLTQVHARVLTHHHKMIICSNDSAIEELSNPYSVSFA